MGNRVFVYVFIPYCLNNGQPESPDYDTPATWTELAKAFNELSITWKWQPITFENLDEIIEKMTLSQHKEGSIVLNFCDGDEINGFPGISVVRKLEEKGIVFSGANSNYYHKTTSKILMKENFEREHVSTAPYRTITDMKKDITGLCAGLGTPLIVKPAISAASWGITLKSIVYTDEEILIQAEELLKGRHGTVFTKGEIFAEKFIKGPEFTVFIVGSSNRPEGLKIYHPVERAFHEGLPPMERLLSYERYWGLYETEEPLPLGQALYTYRLVEDEDLKERICDLALRAYKSVDGYGYGRIDIRLDNESGELFVLEVNSNCGISSDDQTSVGQILRLSGASYTHLLSEILNDAVIRHEGGGNSKL